MPETGNTAPLAARKVEKLEKIESAANTVTATIAEKVQHSAEAASQGLHEMQADVTGGLKQAAEMARTYADVQRSALESVARASQIFSEGLQGLATHAADVNRTQFEHTISHMRALTGVKSVKEAMSLQAQFARVTASRALSEGSVLLEDYLKLATQALAPVTARAREAAEKVKYTL